ncbi:hypothetical protein ASPWEDRAFT_179210 [Aspergillus wentii DTO 134E9]|uniref:Uncharacterized protein n=1 Tax=Aspergillus wentii DTO 134E9 TaxID=1073089 RepID=A0A1L9S2V3_ASPWE|nr:uncharacterized protein ASPWEDRAFT_179210 [Aspergillus wentii DTO 134E9]OJJ41483.1 hypothetical protein ASPWEDRAFT_179210 [Aspergillus wentii DTO 134E9]
MGISPSNLNNKMAIKTWYIMFPRLTSSVVDRYSKTELIEQMPIDLRDKKVTVESSPPADFTMTHFPIELPSEVEKEVDIISGSLESLRDLQQRGIQWTRKKVYL